MGREECEKKIAQQLEAIREVVRQYKPDFDMVNIAISPDTISAFSLERDDNGDAIRGEYILNLFQWDKEAQNA